MGNWNDLLTEVRAEGSEYDVVRRRYLAALAEITGRNTIVYYSAWLQKGNIAGIPPTDFSVNDTDKNAFMATIHRLDRSRGLDLLLHTPGGSVAATESLVEYLMAMFQGDVRAVVPQLAMSAGTMIALASREILMGSHSSLGPIDPQIAGLPAHGLIEEFSRARAEIEANPVRAALWQPIIAKYNPVLLGEAEKAIEWSTEISRTWLLGNMFAGDPDGPDKVARIVAELADHALTKSHARHIGVDQAVELGLKVRRLEDDNALQDAVLSAHHITIQTLSATPAVKLVENHNGVAYLSVAGAL